MSSFFNHRMFEEELASIEHEYYPMTAAGREAAEVCHPLMNAIVKAGSPLAHLWSVSPRYGELILVSHSVDPELKAAYGDPEIKVLQTDNCLAGTAVASRRCHYFPDLAARDGKRRFADAKLIERLPIGSLLAVPVPNVGNPHQILFVVSLFLRDHDSFSIAQLDQLKKRLRTHAQLLADAIESNLRERSFRAAMTVSQKIGNLFPFTKETAYRTLATIVRKAIDASEVAVFTDNWSGTDLQLRARVTNYADSLRPTTIPTKVNGWVKKVQSRNRESLITVKGGRIPAEVFSAEELTRNPQSAIFVPLHNVKGKCRGVIKCIKFSERRGRQLFTYDDISIIEAMEQAFGPSFEMILGAEQREVSVQKLAHELRVPIAAFGAILEHMQRECDDRLFEFRFNHFNEATNYVNLMNRLSKEIDFVRKGPSEATLVFQETRLISAIIAPAVRFIAPLLRKRRFRASQVSFTGFDNLPSVELDAAFISQVLFNHLENAIKYFPAARGIANFKCTVEGKRAGGFVEIHISDNGDPILEDDRERIFEFGFRGEKAKAMDSDGSGLGLWISRAVVERHGGRLDLADNSTYSNTFVIQLPIVQRRPSMSNVPLRPRQE